MRLLIACVFGLLLILSGCSRCLFSGGSAGTGSNNEQLDPDDSSEGAMGVPPVPPRKSGKQKDR